MFNFGQVNFNTMRRIYLSLLFTICLLTSSSGQLIINEVLYDPSNSGLLGDANGDSIYSQAQDEFIEFVNTGNTSFDIGGYQIADSSITTNAITVHYVFPNGISIPAGGALVVFGGGTPRGLFGGAIVLADTGVDGLSMNNSGEVILLRNATANVVLRFNSDALSNNPDESYTRNPDLIGDFVQHAGINTRRFSPGTKVNGTSFITSSVKQVMLKIDMNELSTSFDSVYVSGNFNQWCNNCNALTDIDRDGLFETNVATQLDTLKYLFVYKSGSNYTEESLASGSPCTQVYEGKNVRTLAFKLDTAITSVCFSSCSSCSNKLSLQGVTDFVTPMGGVSGKGIHVRATAAIADLSIYGLGVANNGGGTDGQEFRFPKTTVVAGAEIFVVRDSTAMKAYLAGCWNKFNHVFVDALGAVNQNGDDAIELFKVGEVAETYGNANEDGTGKPWEYTGSWAYKVSGGSWINGALNCTDSTKTTMYDTECIYPICADVLVSEITVSSPSTSITINGGTLQMTATVLPSTASNKNVTWSVDSSSLASISSSGLLTAKANGVVTVKAIANDGSGVSGIKQITISGQTSSLQENVNNAFVLYPNPVSDRIFITSEFDVTHFEVFDFNGKKLAEGKPLQNEVEMNGLSSGVYFINLYTSNSTGRFKVIKQ